MNKIIYIAFLGFICSAILLNVGNRPIQTTSKGLEVQYINKVFTNPFDPKIKYIIVYLENESASTNWQIEFNQNNYHHSDSVIINDWVDGFFLDNIPDSTITKTQL
ncbi:hypothetical protein HOE31_03990 [bacterium]|jgi:hypothetical protein|nr:hypothetical protein [bacterium]MBT4122079.1 hypothetical protein [bacterium]MBT4335587.1 hypothetical protein [bacterium]MBT4495584.1 hypothetical protein [bacterium]MBT4764242.1 hypothetical protein [bacterium]